MSGTEERESVRRRGIGPAFLAFHQIAAVLSSIALAAMVARVFHYGWRSGIAELIAYWDHYARPVARSFFDWVFVAPLGWIGLHVELDQAAIDYLAVGLIASVSYRRQWERVGLFSDVADIRPGWPTWKKRAAELPFMVFYQLLIVFFWVFLVGSFIFFSVAYLITLLIAPERLTSEDRRAFGGFVLTLSPLGYLSILFAANQLLL